ILKAIAKNPSDRFSTAGELARELGRFVEGRPIHSRRALLPERLWRWSRRNPAVALLALLAALLSTVLAIGSTTAAITFRDQPNAVQKEQRNTRAELGRSYLLQARAMRSSKQLGRRSESLTILARAVGIAREAGAPPEQMEALRDEVVSTLAEVDERPVKASPAFNMPPETTAFSVDSDRFVVLGPDRSVHFRRLSDQSEIRVVKPKSFAEWKWPLIVPGGRFMAVGTGLGRQIGLFDLERGEAPPNWPDEVRGIAARPDGRQI